MNSSQSATSKATEATSQIRMVYAYYCKLNQQKLKHKSFDEVETKTTSMHLHEFMTLCKDFSLIHKQKRTSEKRKLNVEAAPLSRVDIIASPEEREPRQSSLVDSESGDGEGMRYVPEKIQGEVENRRDPEMVPHTSHEEGGESQPLVYLDHLKLAEIFKRQAVSAEEVDFDAFMRILGKVALLMYGTDDPNTYQKLLKSRVGPQRNEKNKTKMSSEHSRIELLKYMHLDSKQSCLQMYKNINELHGGMEHLALMRSPIKRVKVKDSSLFPKKKSRQEKQNATYNSSTNHHLKGKGKSPALTSLPQVGKKKNNPSSKLTPKDTNSYLAKHFKIDEFVKAHQKQIDALNTNQSRVAAHLAVPTCQQPESESIESRSKKYSERHTDKVVKDPAHKQFTKYIDFSNPYQDQIFNQFVSMNNKSASPGSAFIPCPTLPNSNFAPPKRPLP